LGNENLRDELRDVFDRMAGSPSSALPDRVRAAVANPPEARGPYWIAAVAAAVIAVLLISVLVVANNQRRPTSTLPAAPSSPSASPSASPTPVASPSASPAASPTPTSQLPAFVCTAQDVPSNQSAPAVANIDALRVGSHSGYDRLTIEFSNGAPAGVQIGAPTAGTTFTMSPSGVTATLKGDHSILITIHGADLHTAYSGSIDIVTGDGTLVEVRRVQDFEGVVQIGLGIKGAGCYRAFWLTGPARLVIDVQAAS
jgi:hypothetical protein